MNFDDYMRKIQYIANVLERNQYAENIINGREIDVIQDFQYICINSAANPQLVNDIIARLAQNGHANVVLQNIRIISMNMWRDLFNINEHIKRIFIDNYDYIFNNATVLSFREVECFLNDTDTCKLIYDRLENTIKKLSTYDRASLIVYLKDKEGGIDRIKSNIKNFFQKGEFDISTTYSKILIELSQIKQISKLEIFNACGDKLEEMLNRETAIDNETNKMLNWLYDAFEETKMTPSDRAEIKKNIDNAILQNFDYILDKTNYDKNTIKILKQFDCTKEKFENDKNHYIDKSDKANSETVNYTMNISELNTNNNTFTSEVDLSNIRQINQKELEQYNVDCINKININNSNSSTQKEFDTNSLDFKVNNEVIEKITNEDSIVNVDNKNNTKSITETNENINNVENSNDTNGVSYIDFSSNKDEITTNKLNLNEDDRKILNIVPMDESIVDTSTNEDYSEKDNLIELFSLDENKVNNNNAMNIEKDIIQLNENEEEENISNIENDENLKIHEINLTDINKKEVETLDKSIKKLISSSIEDTDKIIERILKKDNIESQVEEHYNRIVQNINTTKSNTSNNNNRVTKNVYTNSVNNNEPIKDYNNSMEQSVLEVEQELNNVSKMVENDSNDRKVLNITTVKDTSTIPESKALVVQKETFVKRIWKKIVKLFKFGSSTERIGE